MTWSKVLEGMYKLFQTYLKGSLATELGIIGNFPLISAIIYVVFLFFSTAINLALKQKHIIKTCFKRTNH